MAQQQLRRHAAGAALFVGFSMFFGPVQADISLSVIGRYDSGQFDNNAAQVVAFDAGSKRLFVANTKSNEVDMLDVSDPTMPSQVKAISMASHGAGVNSVAVREGIVAVAVENEDPQANGSVVFLDVEGKVLSKVTIGAMPDMVGFTPDGKYVVVANEGEPNDGYTNDPEGSVSIVDISGGVEGIGDANVKTADFRAYDEKGLPEGAKVGKPGQPLSQDFEPEYVAVSPDSKTAFVTLQEHNAVAVVDIANAKVTNVFGMGFKNYEKNPIDASDKDGKIDISPKPNVFGIYQPDGVAVYSVGGQTYIITANEGDSREYDAFVDEARVEDVKLDPKAFPDATLKEAEKLGRLKIATTLGDTDGDGDYDQLYNFGARSISIWDTSGTMVWDSGSGFEEMTAAIVSAGFNADNDDCCQDKRSDDKGPEPETVVVGELNGKYYAFTALERISGIIVYDVTNPQSPNYVTFAHNRKFAVNPKDSPKGAGDLGPEGLAFIPAAQSPNGKPLLAVGNEVSGTTTIYQID